MTQRDLLGLLLDLDGVGFYISCACNQNVYIHCEGEQGRWEAFSGAESSELFDIEPTSNIQDYRLQLHDVTKLRDAAFSAANKEVQDAIEAAAEKLKYPWTMAPEPRECSCWWYRVEKELIDDGDEDYWLTRSLTMGGPLNTPEDLENAMSTPTPPRDTTNQL